MKFSEQCAAWANCSVGLLHTALIRGLESNRDKFNICQISQTKIYIQN